MQKSLIVLAAAFSMLGMTMTEPASAGPPSTPAPIVFFDVAGPDAARLKLFYASNFGWKIDNSDGITAPNLKGTLRQDPPETLIYLGVKDIDAALKGITASGGSVVLPRTVVQNVVIFALFKDPAGNRMGLVETK